MLDLNKIYCMDCLEGMKEIPDNTIDLILTDLPYGMTQNKWDCELNLELLWCSYKRIIKDNGVIALTSIQPFSSKLVMSNLNMFKYSWVWDKKISTNFLNSKKQPLRKHEDILIFYTKQCCYNPQMSKGLPYDKGVSFDKSPNYGKQRPIRALNISGDRYPTSILEISNANRRIKSHPTEKPIQLFEYLIKTYTNEGDLVLDSCLGSGTTAVACKQLGRDFIGFELSQEYVDIANKRLSQGVLSDFQ